MVVVIAVPPDMDGENCKMSRKGGSWDELKRTMTWTWCVDSLNPGDAMDSLNPGDAIEIQAQFPVLEGSVKPPQFPVLVKCDYPVLFSAIDLTISDDFDAEMKLRVQASVLHRKV
jgi:hypothetical protein